MTFFSKKQIKVWNYLLLGKKCQIFWLHNETLMAVRIMDLKIIAEAVVGGWELKNSNVLSNIDEIWNAYWKTLAKIGCCFWPRTSLWLVNVSDPQHALRRNLIFGPDSNNAAKSVSQITNSFSTVVPQHFIFPFKVTSEHESDTQTST